MSTPVSCATSTRTPPKLLAVYVAVGVLVGLGVWAGMSALPALPVFEAGPLAFAAVSGLLAGVTSCGVLAGVTAFTISAEAASAGQRVWRTARFHISRVTAFILVGGALGATGAALPTEVFEVVRFVLASLIVVLVASMIGVLPKLPTSSVTRVSNPELAGVLTVLAPCGLTLAVFLTAASTSSMVWGGVLCAVFALFTVPGLSVYASVPAFTKSQGARSVTLVAAAALGVASLLIPSQLLSAAASPGGATQYSVGVDGAVHVPVSIYADRYDPSVVSVPEGSRVVIDFAPPQVWNCMATPTLPNGEVANTISGPLSYDLGVLPPGEHFIACPSSGTKMLLLVD